MKKLLLGLMALSMVACVSTQKQYSFKEAQSEQVSSPDSYRRPAQVVGNVGSTLSASTTNEWINSAEKGLRKPGDFKIEPARVLKVDSVVSKQYSFGNDQRNLEVRIITTQSGGTTDMSPMRRIYFGIYSENEMFDLIGNYLIGTAFKVESVKRISGGIYELTGWFGGGTGPGDKKITKLTIDAINAINEAAGLKCGEFDVCKLKSNITVTPK